MYPQTRWAGSARRQGSGFSPRAPLWRSVSTASNTLGSPTVNRELEGVPRASAPTPQPLEIGTAVGDPHSRWRCAHVPTLTSVPLSNARTQLSRLRRLTQATADEAICQRTCTDGVPPAGPDPTAVGDPHSRWRSANVPTLTSVPLSNARTQLSRLRRLTQATADEVICVHPRWRQVAVDLRLQPVQSRP